MGASLLAVAKYIYYLHGLASFHIIDRTDEMKWYTIKHECLDTETILRYEAMVFL